MIILQFWNLEVWNELSSAALLLEALGKNVFSSLLQLLKEACTPCLMISSYISFIPSVSLCKLTPIHGRQREMEERGRPVQNDR